MTKNKQRVIQIFQHIEGNSVVVDMTYEYYPKGGDWISVPKINRSISTRTYARALNKAREWRKRKPIEIRTFIYSHPNFREAPKVGRHHHPARKKKNNRSRQKTTVANQQTVIPLGIQNTEDLGRGISSSHRGNVKISHSFRGVGRAEITVTQHGQVIESWVWRTNTTPSKVGKFLWTSDPKRFQQLQEIYPDY